MILLLENTKYCLESDFIINLLDGKTNAVRFYEEIKDLPLAITAVTSVTLFEILRGRERNQLKIQKFDELRQKLEVLPFGEKEAEEASRIEIELHQKGFTIGPDDLFIGATAKTNEAILVSNDSDYNRIDGLQLRSY